MEYYLSYGWGDKRCRKVRGVHTDKFTAVTETANAMTKHETPREWGMFTSAGNRSISCKADRLVADLANYVRRPDAFRRFFRSFKKLYGTKTMGEAGDTAVREIVLGFAMRFKDLVGGEDKVYALWDEEGCR